MFNISKSQIEILFSNSKSSYVNVNMCFPNINYERNLCIYVFGKLFWHYRELKSECWTSRHVLCEKKYFFVYVGIRILVKKWNMYETHIFPSPLQQTCRLETTSLCLNTRLRVKKNVKIHIILFEINVNVGLLCAHHVMSRIILHTRRPNCQ